MLSSRHAAVGRDTRLAIVVSHPIQYYVPLYRSLAARPGVTVKVFFTWHGGAGETIDRGFQRAFKWDIPLTEGYDYEIVPNTAADPGTHRFMGLKNPTLVAAVTGWRPDVVHITGYAWWSHLLTLRALHRRGIPVVFRGDSHLLDPTSRLRRWAKELVLQKVYSWPAAFLCVGAANRAYYTTMGVGPERLFHCPHSIDVDRFANDADRLESEARQWRRELGISDDCSVLLFAGKFEQRKRPIELMTAFAQANPARSLLLMVGDGELGGEVRRIAEANPHLFRVLPFQNQSRMPVVYRLGDLFVLPSAYGETWGLAINEAMACARPALVTSRVGCAVDLVDDSCGAIVRADDWPALMATASRLLRDRGRLRQMGREALRRSARFNIEATTVATLSCIEATLCDESRLKGPKAGRDAGSASETPRFVCTGFFGRPNFGDELLCWVVLRELKRLYPRCHTSVITHDRATSAMYTQPNATLVEGIYPAPRFFLRIMAQLRAIRRADLLIVGGGGLINDYYSWHAIPRFAMLVFLGILFAKPVVFVGLGVAPVGRTWLAKLAQFAITNSQGVYIRDVESARRVQAWLQPGTAAIVAPDLAALIASRLEELSNGEPQEPQPHYLLANFRDDPAIPLATLVGICREALQRCPELILLASEVHDVALYRKISAMLDPAERARTTIEFPLSLRLAVGLIKSATWVIAERLHVNLIAAFADRPLYAIEYESKVTAQMGDVLHHPLRCPLTEVTPDCVRSLLEGVAKPDAEARAEAESAAREAFSSTIQRGLGSQPTLRGLGRRSVALFHVFWLMFCGLGWLGVLTVKRILARLAGAA
jgi:glycosyltransferase involved in cell wall biosynthesis/polysaccharide pyruvyl transferase WcaK-like protein